MFIFPENEPLTDEGNVQIFDPPNVDLGSEPFDLGELIGIDDNTYFPKGDSFLRDLLNGRLEFPDEGEGGSYFLAIESFSEGIDEPTRNLIGLSDVDEVLDIAFLNWMKCNNSSVQTNYEYCLEKFEPRQERSLHLKLCMFLRR